MVQRFQEGEEVTMRKMSTVIGSCMRMIPHIDVIIIVDINEDTFYLIESVRKTALMDNVYKIVYVGTLTELIQSLIAERRGMKTDDKQQ